MTDLKTKIKELVDALGSYEAVAFKLNVTTNAVWKWAHDNPLRMPHRINRVQIDRLHKRICGKKLINQSPSEGVTQ